MLHWRPPYAKKAIQSKLVVAITSNSDNLGVAISLAGTDLFRTKYNDNLFVPIIVIIL